MIDSADISVVVQGPVNYEQTKECLKSIRKFLPKSEIILSTWVHKFFSWLGEPFSVVYYLIRIGIRQLLSLGR